MFLSSVNCVFSSKFYCVPPILYGICWCWCIYTMQFYTVQTCIYFGNVWILNVFVQIHFWCGINRVYLHWFLFYFLFRYFTVQSTAAATDNIIVERMCVVTASETIKLNSEFSHVLLLNTCSLFAFLYLNIFGAHRLKFSAWNFFSTVSIGCSLWVFVCGCTLVER